MHNTLTAHSDGSGAITLEGRTHEVRTASIDDARSQLMAIAKQTAQQLGHSITMTAEDTAGTFHLCIHPNGQVEPLEDAPQQARNPFTQSFIEPHRTTVGAGKSLGGFAGVLAAMGIGGPSASQRAEDADRIAVSHVWTRPKTIAVANPKGGASKTPTTICLAAMFARYGGGMVVAVDNNVTRGTLGWRTETTPHGATMADLRRELPHFTGQERASDMARFTHHQTDDRFDVLQSVPKKLAKDQALTDDEFDQVQQILQRYYRVIVMDSGNDESAAPWLAMIRHSDALVVPTSTAPDRLETASLMLAELIEQGGHGADLARNAVVVITHGSTNEPDPEQIAPRFRGAREVLTIPHDPAMASTWLKWDGLAPKTQRAWLAVGAAVARGMED